jgi:hypothetical protein
MIFIILISSMFTGLWIILFHIEGQDVKQKQPRKKHFQKN